MSDETTARLSLPFLQSGQAQKELTHNEALTLLDITVQPVVQAVGLTTPPATPQSGQCWIVGIGATGAWTGRAGALAGWTAGGWRFAMPVEGMSAWSRNDLCVARYLAGQWEIGTVRARRLTIEGIQVVGAPQPAIAVPSGGTIIDVTARQTISEIIVSLQRHGLIMSAV